MSSYFKSARHQFGVAMLAVACAITVVWLRSYSTEDRFQLDHEWSYRALHTLRGGMIWYRTSHQLGMEGWSSAATDPRGTTDPLYCYTDPADIKWRRELGGFDLGEMDYNGAKVEWLRIPFYSIVLPLTAAAAYLLLSKRGQQRSTSQPDDQQ